MKIERLNEAFSDSMPRWLKAFFRHDVSRDRVNDTRVTHNKSARQRMARAMKAYPEIADFEDQEYTGRGDSYYDYVFKKLSEAGLDLSRIKIIEAPVPTKGNDPILKDPNLVPIFLVENNGKYGVYIKGFNDTQDTILPLPDGRQTRWKYIGIKDLLDHTKAFAYFDKTDKDNYLPPDLIKDRVWNKANMPDNYERQPKDKVGHFVSNWTNKGMFSGTVDKSGYIVNPDRYLPKLKELKRKKLPKEVKKVYKRLNGFFQDMADCFASAATDFDTFAELSAFSNDYKIDELRSNYKQVIYSLEELAALGDNPQTDNKRTNLEDGILNNLSYINKGIDKAYKRLGKFIYDTVEWEPDEYEYHGL